MRIGICGILILLLASALGGCASEPEGERPLQAMVTLLPLRAKASTQIPCGEVSIYDMHWGVLPVGRVIYRVESARALSRRWRVLTASSRSSPLISAFLKASGTIRSLVDRQSWLPEISLWTTSEGKNPQVRSVDFRQAQGLAFSVKHTRDLTQAEIFHGPQLRDPLTSIFLARVVKLPPPGASLRWLMVEGANLHLVTLRQAGRQNLAFQGQSIPCVRLAVRTDRLDAMGHFLDPAPWNNLFVWVALQPVRPILKISGKTPYARVTLTLRERRLEGPTASLQEGPEAP